MTKYLAPKSHAPQPLAERFAALAKEGRKALAPFEDRVRMCELASAGVRGVHVCTAEAELAADPLVGRTARTLEHLAGKHPERRFALVLGADGEKITTAKCGDRRLKQPAAAGGSDFGADVFHGEGVAVEAADHARERASLGFGGAVAEGEEDVAVGTRRVGRSC